MIGEVDVARLRQALLVGGVAVVPTDTVYGLAAALDSPEGVGALYALKGRPRSQPCQVLIYSAGLLDQAIAGLDEATAAAVRALLPGPATCIVPDTTGRYAAASAGADSVGIRAPATTGAISRLDLPLVATSANEPGGPDPDRIANVEPRLVAGADLVLDAGVLPGTASAVVDLRSASVDRTATLIRPGPAPDQVRAMLGRVGVSLVDG